MLSTFLGFRASRTAPRWVGDAGKDQKSSDRFPVERLEFERKPHFYPKFENFPEILGRTLSVSELEGEQFHLLALRKLVSLASPLEQIDLPWAVVAHDPAASLEQPLRMI